MSLFTNDKDIKQLKRLKQLLQHTQQFDFESSLQTLDKFFDSQGWPLQASNKRAK